jgi:hypothetical protein
MSYLKPKELEGCFEKSFSFCDGLPLNENKIKPSIKVIGVRRQAPRGKKK